MRELILVRHAKSDWPENCADKDRPISDRGKKDCELAANYFNTIDDGQTFKIIVSSSKRTKDTWKEISKALRKLAQFETFDEIYEASLGELLYFVQNRADERMIIVGHNPGLALLGAYLTGEQVGSFPTLSIWHLRTDSFWQDSCAQTIARLAPRADPTNTDSD